MHQKCVCLAILLSQCFGDVLHAIAFLNEKNQQTRSLYKTKHTRVYLRAEKEKKRKKEKRFKKLYRWLHQY